ncbi:MAG TPA: hypothetical protein VG248_09120 [Caulobacteraceae bacterium]|jgi:hypothetical protein|nr:hypothetical protein [Caulobacteraceae bacterium]
MTALALVEGPGTPWASDPASARRLGVWALATAGSAAAILALAGALRGGAKGRRRGPETRLHAAAAGLFGSVLADSAIEHYRGGFENPGMLTPLIVSTAGIVAAVRPAPGWARDGVYGVALAAGLAGFGFHVFNILRRPGGLDWQGLFYAAPIGAPAALTLGGAFGLAADRLESQPADRPRTLVGQPAGRVLAAASAVGLAGAATEASLLHFRGAFHDPFMWLPVSAPPLGALLMARTAVETRGSRRRTLSDGWLNLVAIVGLAGVGFHAFGIHRRMGGWRNWSQNLLAGPPLPAPPSFTAVALAALAALELRELEDA